MATVEKYIIEKDMRVLCIAASSFPTGVLTAHKKLYSIFPLGDGRMFYGISWSDGKGGILYKAAAEQLKQGESKIAGVELFLIRKGEYISILLKDWRKEERLVEKTFKKLLAVPGIDKNGYCLEMYLNEKDMRCLVPLANSYKNSNKLKMIPIFI